MSKHTLGPWTVSGDFVMAPIRGRGIAGTEAIARVEPHYETPGFVSEYERQKAEANRALIAAAPDLLHFAKWAEQACDGPIPLDPFNLRLAVARLAREVIAKADGK